MRIEARTASSHHGDSVNRLGPRGFIPFVRTDAAVSVLSVLGISVQFAARVVQSSSADSAYTRRSAFDSRYH